MHGIFTYTLVDFAFFLQVTDIPYLEWFRIFKINIIPAIAESEGTQLMTAYELGIQLSI